LDVERSQAFYPKYTAKYFQIHFHLCLQLQVEPYCRFENHLKSILQFDRLSNLFLIHLFLLYFEKNFHSVNYLSFQDL
jgi:hypothetical protein